MPKLYDEYLRKIGVLNVVFAAGSVGLLLVLVWMVVDDYARGWKGYQKDFARLESQKTEQALKEAEEKVNRNELRTLQGELEQARAAMSQHAAERRAEEDALRRIGAENYRDDLTYRTLKSTYDARRFDYEEAREHGDPKAPALYKEMQDLERRLQEYDVRLKEEDKAKKAAEAALNAVVGKAEAVQKQIDDLTAGLSRAQKRLETVAPRGVMRVAIDLLNAPLLDFMAPTIRIQQAVLNGMPIDINFTSIPRADRCQTCHLAADRKGFEDAPEPFRTHPRIDLFLGSTSPHPPDRFGCTPCHGGRDRAVEFVYAAHTPDTTEQEEAWKKAYHWERDHLWDFPMLARSRTEAGCLKCHQGVARVPEAPHLDRGIALVERYGCFGCHKMRGFTDLRKVGPPLVRITSKTTPEWMARWIRSSRTVDVISPTEFRTYNEDSTIVHAFRRSGGDDPRLQEDRGDGSGWSDLVARKCTSFAVAPNVDSTSLTLTLELEDKAENRVAASTRAALRNRRYKFGGTP